MPLPRLTKLELRIMDALWTRGAASIREIQEAFPEAGRPAYTTIQTTVYRLETKQALRRLKKIGNAHIFEPVVSRVAAQCRLIDDLLAFFGGRTQPVMLHFIESGKLTLDDVQEVSNYVAAMNYGLKRLEKLPLSLRLLKEIHGVLMRKGRGSKKEPGEFRRSQNWVGGTRPGNAVFVPPPPDLVLECLGALEKFLHNDPVKTPLLIKAALAHVQFETIHPFLDGNGRLGRLLITFLFCAEGALREPLLYLSLYFKQHRQQYYDLLQSVRLTGDWEAWVRFFLNGVEETANQAGQTAKALMKLAAQDAQRIQAIGKASGSALRVHRLLQAQPILSIASAGEELKLSVPTVTASLKHLAKLGIARETTGRNYGRIYAYDKYLKILNEGTEPLD